jgi:hypothetical protein
MDSACWDSRHPARGVGFSAKSTIGRRVDHQVPGLDASDTGTGRAATVTSASCSR